MTDRARPMNDIPGLTLSVFAGAALGATFFGGLWWTVRAGLGSRIPAIWFLGSFGLRMAVVVAGFYFASHADWRNSLACLLGFLTARFATMRLTRPALGSVQ
jgi:F1F0 ATPase subunit 2